MAVATILVLMVYYLADALPLNVGRLRYCRGWGLPR